MTITDPYRWLEDQNSPETRAWIDRENAYTDSVLAIVPRREFAPRIEQLLKSDQIALSVYRNGRNFFSRRVPTRTSSRCTCATAFTAAIVSWSIRHQESEAHHQRRY